MKIILLGFIASLLAGLATSLGALPVFFLKSVSKKLYSLLLGFSAGIMLSASFFSLLLPALEKGDIYQVSFGFLLGALFLRFSDKLIPHQHFLKGKEGSSSHLRRVFLFILAIAIHNFPEGLSVGVGFGTGQLGKALALAIGIGLQNIPEGTAVALPLRTQGYSKGFSFYIATLTGLVEPLGGLLGVTLVVLFSKVLALTLSFAAGAMVYVISAEIIPETHREGFGKIATAGLIIGFIFMMVLDTIFK